MYRFGLIICALVAFLVPSVTAAAQSGGTLVVDGDRRQCANAGFTSIQAAGATWSLPCAPNPARPRTIVAPAAPSLRKNSRIVSQSGS
jgi:hypothetical protein